MKAEKNLELKLRDIGSKRCLEPDTGRTYRTRIRKGTLNQYHGNMQRLSSPVQLPPQEQLLRYSIGVVSWKIQWCSNLCGQMFAKRIGERITKIEWPLASGRWHQTLCGSMLGMCCFGCVRCVVGARAQIHALRIFSVAKIFRKTPIKIDISLAFQRLFFCRVPNKTYSGWEKTYSDNATWCVGICTSSRSKKPSTTAEIWGGNSVAAMLVIASGSEAASTLSVNDRLSTSSNLCISNEIHRVARSSMWILER